MRSANLALFGCIFFACGPLANVCNQRKEEMLRADGGAYGCTIADQCPRESSVYVCTTDGLPERTCVSCEGDPSGLGRCVRHVAIPCRN